MTESEFYQLVQRKLERWTWDRVESTINSGQPDCIASHGYKCQRIELKILRGTMAWFEPSQISWSNRMVRNNVHNIWVLTYHEKQDRPYMFPYKYVPTHARSMPKRRKYMLDVTDIPITYTDWEAINRALRYNYG